MTTRIGIRGPIGTSGAAEFEVAQTSEVSLIGGILGFVAGSGGLDGDGGVPDLVCVTVSDCQML